MANKQLPEFLTAENDLDGQEPVYIAQSGKTRKTTLQKIKEFIIGVTTMGTTATDVTGAVKELNDKIGSDEKEGSIIAQLNEMMNNFKSENITLLNGWTLKSGELKIIKIGNACFFSMKISGGTGVGNEVIFNLPSQCVPTNIFVINGTYRNGIDECGHPSIAVRTEGNVRFSLGTQPT